MKRFTDTDKWRDPWFRKLTPGMKLAFLFIVDSCDAAGVWDADKELADFSIGSAVPWDKVLEAMGPRAAVLPSGKWHLTKFVQFQYGQLSEQCRPHGAIFSLIEKHGIDRVSKGYPKGTDTLSAEPSNKPVKPAKREPKRTATEGIFELFWEAYPRKTAKVNAAAAWEKHGCDEIAEKIMAAVTASKRSDDWRRDGGQFIPYPATWLNRRGWEDQLQIDLPDAGVPHHTPGDDRL